MMQRNIISKLKNNKNKIDKENIMSLLKSEAIMTLCFEMGYSDGEYSEEEIKSVCANPRFQVNSRRV